MNRITSLVGLVIVLCVHAVVRGDFTAQAVLLGAGEVPPSASAATGTASFHFDAAANDLTYTVTFTGLTAPASASHIHFGLPTTASGPVILPIGNTPPATSGTYTGTLTAANLSPNPANGINTFADAVNAIQNDHTYFNIHDATFPGGEIRGELLVPEPSTLGVLAVSTLGVLLRRTRSRS